MAKPVKKTIYHGDTNDLIYFLRKFPDFEKVVLVKGRFCTTCY